MNWLRATLVGLVASALVVPCLAQEPTTRAADVGEEEQEESGPFWRDKPITSWLTWTRSIADPDRGKVLLETLGLTVEPFYTLDYSVNTHGGLNTERAQEYRGLFTLTIGIDTTRFGFWKGGQAVVVLQNQHGPDATERHVGDLQAFSNIDAPDFLQFS